MFTGIESWNQPFLLPQVLERYAQVIHDRGAPLQNCFGFVDGTLCRVARPQNNQRAVYNGHKRVHAIKFEVQVYDWSYNLTTFIASIYTSSLSRTVIAMYIYR